ncbi:hypothetical protein C8R44DRAFT_728200 [Mycena epipterygia]|nr:hypothetical protein C8R44DRAFT_728200 [Mycena epipterygia]
MPASCALCVVASPPSTRPPGAAIVVPSAGISLPGARASPDGSVRGLAPGADDFGGQGSMVGGEGTVSPKDGLGDVVVLVVDGKPRRQIGVGGEGTHLQEAMARSSGEGYSLGTAGSECTQNKVRAATNFGQRGDAHWTVSGDKDMGRGELQLPNWVEYCVHVVTSIILLLHSLVSTATMPIISLARTNMSIGDMIPDTVDPSHDSRFWCLPRMHAEVDAALGRGSGFLLYLVTQGCEVGIWKDWTVVNALVTGYPGGAQRRHHSVQGCIEEWQQHCCLGIHPHPVDPEYACHEAALRNSAEVATQSPGRTRACPVEAGLQAQLQMYCMPRLAESSGRSSSMSTTSSVTACSWADVPAATRYYAIWRGEIIYTER